MSLDGVACAMSSCSADVIMQPVTPQDDARPRTISDTSDENSSSTDCGLYSTDIDQQTANLARRLARSLRIPPWLMGRSDIQRTVIKGKDRLLEIEVELLDIELANLSALMCCTPAEYASESAAYTILQWAASQLDPESVLLPTSSWMSHILLPEHPRTLGLISQRVSAKDVANLAMQHGFRILPEKGIMGAEVQLVHLESSTVITMGHMNSSDARVSSNIATLLHSDRNAWQATLALAAILHQAKYLDTDGGLKSDALAVMMLTVANKYGAFTPTAGRLLRDFLSIYRFHFSAETHSVSIYHGDWSNYEYQWMSKAHPEDALSVLDPSWTGSGEATNLARELTKWRQVRALFEYCHTAMTAWTGIDNQVRCQSPLSTILGGLSLWVRVVSLFRQGVEPYATEVRLLQGSKRKSKAR